MKYLIFLLAIRVFQIFVKFHDKRESISGFLDDKKIE